MSYELIIQSGKEGVTIALLKDRRLVEYHQEESGSRHHVGDLYLGQVKRLAPGNNAAFIDVGHSKDAFLHYLDLGPQVRSLHAYTESVRKGAYPHSNLDHLKPLPDIEKTGKITQVLSRNQQILVQVTKEPINTKGPRLGSEISLPGTYMVLVPFSQTVSVSKKIKTNEERSRLKKLAESIRPRNFGLIIRTSAEDKTVAELHKDLEDLEDKWKKITESLKFANSPKRIHSENDRTITLIRDLLSDSFQQIVVDNQTLFDELKQYLVGLGNGKEKILKLHTGKLSVFQQFEIDKKIKLAFGKNVPVHGGAYLVIEHTEAMHVIDVNSGSKSSGDSNQEDHSLQVNLEAASEIARQLRLRDMGGIIVCDFIDLRNPAHKKTVFEKLKSEMDTDRAKHTILPMSRFGLIEITRQRVRPEINIAVGEVCPMCEGSGESKSSAVLLDKIENSISHFSKELNMKRITLVVHPIIKAYYSKGGLFSKHWKWFFKLRIKVKLIEERSFHLGQFQFLNEMGEEMEIV